MDMLSPVSLSGQVALTRRLETIANNIANAGTAGGVRTGIASGRVLNPRTDGLEHQGA